MKKSIIIVVVLLSMPIVRGGGLATAACTPDEKTQLGRELVQKAGVGDLAAVKDLLRGGADINFQEGGELTPLLAALSLRLGIDPLSDFPTQCEVQLTKIAVAKFLIEQGADVNKAAQGEESPLIAALIHCNDELLRLLLARGANPNYKTPPRPAFPHGIDAVQFFCSMHRRDLATLIIDESKFKVEPEILANCLFHSLYRHDIPFAQYLIEKGAVLTKKASDIGFDTSDDTPLIVAAKEGYADIVRLLIERIKAEKSQVLNALLAGAELVPEAEREEQGGASVRPEDVVRILQPIVASGIINAKDNKGHTALWYARHGQQANPAIAEMLVQAGAAEE